MSSLRKTRNDGKSFIIWHNDPNGPQEIEITRKPGGRPKKYAQRKSIDKSKYIDLNHYE